MSSFLDRFSGENYDAGEKKTAAAISSPEHNTVVDREFGKKKLIRNIIIAVSIFAVGVMIFAAVRLANRVTVKDFTGTPIDEAKRWGLTSGITVETEYEFSVEYDENDIIHQSVEPLKKIQKGSIISFTVSRGADPDERIELPDFSGMTTQEVGDWKASVRADNAVVTLEYSDTVPSGEFIRKKFANDGVNESNYTRADGLQIYMSRGVEVFEANITMPGFKGKSKDEAEYFAAEHELEVTYKEEASDTVPAGMIISQSVEKGTKIAKKSGITFVVSLGPAVTVPDFNDVPMDDAAGYEGLAVTVKRMYSESCGYGRVISQSETAGTELTGDNNRVTVVYSLGKPYIDNMIGQSEKELPAYFYDFRTKGADITYTVKYVSSPEPKGQIVGMSRYAEYVSMKASVTIQVSRGNGSGTGAGQSDSGSTGTSNDGK